MVKLVNELHVLLYNYDNKEQMEAHTAYMVKDGYKAIDNRNQFFGNTYSKRFEKILPQGAFL